MQDIKGRRALVEGRFRRDLVPVRRNHSGLPVNLNIKRENTDDISRRLEQSSSKKPPKKKRNFVSKAFFKTPLLLRVGVGVAVLLILADVIFPLLDAKRNLDKYDISAYETRILSSPIDMYGNKLAYDYAAQKYIYNANYSPVSGEVAGQNYSPKVSAEFGSNGQGVTLNDPYNNVSLGFKPQFGLGAPQKNINRVVYPISKLNATKVYTLKATGFKEDIILREFQGKEMEFTYKLELSEGTEAKLEGDGSLAVYGVEAALLGNVSTGNEQDAELLKKARENSEKKKLLFVIPKPVIIESNKKVSAATVKYELKDNELTVVASNLDKGNYPLSIDPSVYVESAAKLMRGNNETNTDFDVDNELIQKSQTTGARIDAWEGNLDMSEGTWGQGSATAGGYVYRTGGETGLYTKPQIVDQASTTQSSNSSSFTMNMPNTRQAGDLYVALMCHDGTGAITGPGGGGWTEYADSQQFAAYYKIGTDAGGGNEAASYTWTGGSEQWYGVILRVTGFNSSDPISGTPGTGSSAGDATPVFPATTPDSSATLVIRAVGADNDSPNDTGWVPPGHTKIDSGNSNPLLPSDTNDCGLAAASLDTPPINGVSTGTTSLMGASLNDSYGAASLAINPSGSPSRPQIEDQTESYQNSNSTTFTMNMPTTRPAGDLYLALLCHDGSNGDGSGGSTSGNTISTPSGWTKYANRQGHAAYYKIGTDAGGGNEAASYQFTGNSENWAGVIIRVSGFDSSDPISGTPGLGHSTSNATPVFPATTPDEDNTLVIRAVGADNDEVSATAWVPSGHSKIASGGSTQNNNDCAFAAATLDASPASGVSTGTATFGDGSIFDDYGASSIAINAVPSSSPSSATRASVNWAKFNSSTLEIESPNPGAGSCYDWCTDPTYDLPAGRKAHSMVAYNGYLYVMGGLDSSDTRVSTVYIAKLGANGEPSLWHPTDPDPDNWDYWYTDAGLSGGTAKSHFGALAYNNRMYVIGGQTNASPGGITTVQMADILPNGILGSWTTTGMQALPSGAGTHMHGVQVYNDTLYSIGGFEGAGTSSANLRNTVYYSKLNADGTMNAWQSTASFAGARSSFGGSYSYIWGAYIYLSGGCTAVNGSGHCTTIADDMQVVSINSDGSLDTWSDMGIETERAGFNLVGWQGGLYRIGGCTQQDASTGDCISSLADVDYGVINPAGEVSTVNISQTVGAGDCTGSSPRDCDLPPVGDNAGQGGQMLSATTILNGYLYVIGGCTNFDCSGSSGNISYTAVGSDGSLQKPAICSGTSYGAWCVDSTNRANGTAGISAAGVTTFNNRIYLIGGIDDSADGVTSILYNSTNSDGSLTGAWSTSTFASAGITGELAYTYAYSRANPTSAGSNPGNLYVIGGCGAISASAGCSSVYRSEVYKCNITTSGSVTGCSTNNQLQLDVELSTETNEGLGLHSGTVYANYIYLIGGFSNAVGDRDTVFYAKFDDSNNIVDVESGTAILADANDDWIESEETLSVGRRRGWAFGYNGHIYAVGGYDDSGTGIIPFIEWSKENVSDGSLDPFVTSSVTINQRWGLSMVVSNSYSYVIGGCDSGPSPGGCTSFEPSIQTFQLYNNNSGTPSGYTAETDLFNTDRVGASSAILDGYIYIAGGCTVEDCSTTTDNVQFAPIDAYGNIGAWSNTTDSTLPGSRGYGQLEVAGGTLYYVGGQSDATTEQNSVYWGTPDPDDGDIAAWTTASNQLPAARSQFGATVWNDRIYVTGGIDSGGTSTSTIYVSPDLSAGGDIGSTWTTSTGFDIARNGHTAIAYANNLYILGGYDGTNYLLDVQFAQIASDGTVGAWTYTTSLPGPIRQADGFAVNGYMYLLGGRSDNNTCESKTIVAPISANTTIASGNNPTGIGEWYETNERYAGKRYGATVSYANGKVYALGGGCNGFPSISSVTTEVFSSATQAHNVDMPATVASGDLLVVLFTNDGNATVTDPDTTGPWTQIATQLRGTAVRGSVWAKVADGTEGATQVNFQTSVSEEAAAQVYQVPAGEWSGTIAGVEAGTFDPGGTTNAPNPPSLNPGAWGTENTLWLAYAAGSSWTLANSYPSGYQGGMHSISNTGTGGASASSAWLNSASASQDPGAFGMSTTSDGVALTIGIRPAGFALTGNNRVVQTALNTQPQVAMYSRLIDTDTDVFPNSWLLNGLDNSIGARWQTRYRSMNDTDGVATDCGTTDMTNWGEETNFGDTTLGNVNTYVPLDGSGADTDCARYFYFFISIDASRTFGYPEDVNRGPTISDLSLFFTSDPSKRLRHGKTFTGGEQQPLDTPCRRGASSPGDPNYNCPLP